jgi:hypothetical protein
MRNLTKSLDMIILLHFSHYFNRLAGKQTKFDLKQTHGFFAPGVKRTPVAMNQSQQAFSKAP